MSSSVKISLLWRFSWCFRVRVFPPPDNLYIYHSSNLHKLLHVAISSGLPRILVAGLAKTGSLYAIRFITSLPLSSPRDWVELIRGKHDNAANNDKAAI